MSSYQVAREVGQLMSLIHEAHAKITADFERQAHLAPALLYTTECLKTQWREAVGTYAISPSVVALGADPVDMALSQLIWTIYETGRRSQAAGQLLTPCYCDDCKGNS